MCRCDRDFDIDELYSRLRAYEHENATLRDAVSRAMCGDLLNHDTSCMLARDHDGLHCFASPDGELIIRWG